MANRPYTLSDDEFSRKLSLFRHIDEDRHNEFINHVSIGISVAITIVVLLAEIEPGKHLADPVRGPTVQVGET